MSRDLTQEVSNTPKKPIRWWQVWRYGELKAQNERNLAQLVHHGPLTEADARYFAALCRGGRRTPDWLVDKLIASADRAKAAGERPE